MVVGVVDMDAFAPQADSSRGGAVARDLTSQLTAELGLRRMPR